MASLDPYKQIRTQGIIDRHARAGAAVASNRGRSAPYSAMDSTPSAQAAMAETGAAEPTTADQRWRDIFPSAPQSQVNPRTGTPFMSAPPRMSALDAAKAASPAPFMPSARPVSIAAPLTSPTGNAGSDAANLQQNMDMASNPRRYVQQQSSVPSVRLDPRLPAAQVSSTGIVRNAPANLPPAATLASTPAWGQSDAGKSARASLYQTNPAIFEAGTPENAAFVAHAKQFGEESAHRNINDLLASL